MKSQFQQRQVQQLKQQILQQPQMQQLHHQRPQQVTPMPGHQMTQLHQMNGMDKLKVRQGSDIESGSYQQHYSAGQHHNYYQQLKTGSSFPLYFPPNLQASSPQNSQHSSHQIDQHNLLYSHPKAGTPLLSTNSPFIVPSPSTPIAPSPIPGEFEKISGISTLQNVVNIGHQQTVISPLPVQSLAVSTPGISASPLLAEFTSPDGSQANLFSAIPGKLRARERPLESSIKAVSILV